MNDLIDRQAVMDAIDKIKYALWEIDIPSPTVPEYIEHHKQVQSVWELVDKKQKELMTLPSVQPELPELCGYRIGHLAYIARVMEQEGITAEYAVRTFDDMGRAIQMIIEEAREIAERSIFNGLNR